MATWQVHRGVPLVCVLLMDRGYDFAKVKPLLTSLRSELSVMALEQMQECLRDWRVSLPQLGRALAETLPQIISVMLEPDGTRAHIDAAVADIARKLKLAKDLDVRADTSGGKIASCVLCSLQAALEALR